MSNDNDSPNFGFLSGVEVKEADFRDMGRQSDTASPKPEMTRWSSSQLTPWVHTSAPQKKAEKLAHNGLILMAVSGVVWLLISNATLMSAASRFDQRPTSIADFESSTPSGFEIWFISTIGQLSTAGFFSGFAMIVLGYAKLFLAKQAVFEQHVQEQLNIRAGGNVDATQLGKGAKYMGDRTNVGGDVVGSAVGRGASVDARDITVFKQTVDNSTNLDTELKEKLTLAREEIDKLDVPQDDKDDVADDLGKLTEELDKPEPTPNRVERFFKRIEEIAPTVGTILASATRIIQLVGIVT